MSSRRLTYALLTIGLVPLLAGLLTACASPAPAASVEAGREPLAGAEATATGASLAAPTTAPTPVKSATATPPAIVILTPADPVATATMPQTGDSGREAAASLLSMMQRGEVSKIAAMVPEDGLVIAPYGVGVPDRGLTGDALRRALEAMLRGARPEFLAYEPSVPGRVNMAVTGLNQIRVAPAVGDALQVTSPAYVSLGQTADRKWQFKLIAVDRYGLLAEALNKAPFEVWK